MPQYLPSPGQIHRAFLRRAEAPQNFPSSSAMTAAFRSTSPSSQTSPTLHPGVKPPARRMSQDLTRDQAAPSLLPDQRDPPAPLQQTWMLPAAQQPRL